MRAGNCAVTSVTQTDLSNLYQYDGEFLSLGTALAEQKRRLVERRDTPDKQWKFSLGDLVERRYWDEYMRAYEDAISATSTDQAPWYVIPADSKTERNLAISRLLLATLGALDLRPPELPPGLAQTVID